MDRLLEFLFKHPIVLFFVLAWVAGAIGNAVKRARTAAPQRPARRVERQPDERSAEEIAREMRRILGMDVEEVRPEPPAPPPPPPRVERRPVVAEVERQETAVGDRSPTPVLPTTGSRRLVTHVDPHVGETIQRRVAPQSGRVGVHDAETQLGALGGRRQGARRLLGASHGLVDLRDLKRALVLGEILGPPLALRGERREP